MRHISDAEIADRAVKKVGCAINSAFTSGLLLSSSSDYSIRLKTINGRNRWSLPRMPDGSYGRIYALNVLLIDRYTNTGSKQTDLTRLLYLPQKYHFSAIEYGYAGCSFRDLDEQDDISRMLFLGGQTIARDHASKF